MTVSGYSPPGEVRSNATEAQDPENVTLSHINPALELSCAVDRELHQKRQWLCLPDCFQSVENASRNIKYLTLPDALFTNVLREPKYLVLA